MWVMYALGSALFAGITAILAKIGIKETSSNVATAIRTGVVLLFAWLMVLIVGSQGTIVALSSKTLVFLILSGLATGASWLCYFRALQIGNVNKVAPVDKSSTILTVLLAIVFLGETKSLAARLAGIAIAGIGTYLMIQRKAGETKTTVGNRWLVYAALSAIFASLTSILGKVGISGVESNLGTAIRTMVVLVMAWVVVFVTKEQRKVKGIPRRDLLFILPVRHSDGCLMALLLQGVTGWSRKPCRADRQAQHRRHYRRRVLLVQRETDAKGARRPCPDRPRYHDHAAVTHDPSASRKERSRSKVTTYPPQVWATTNSTAAQPGQRTTSPIAFRWTMSPPMGLVEPQAPHVAGSGVTSRPKISRRSPPDALPSKW